MPAIDQCHEQVVRAFEKDGWTISAAPYRLQHKLRLVYVDLAMSRQSNGSRENLLCIEVKCFQDVERQTHDLYVAIGQYLIYQSLLTTLGLDIVLYLAVPKAAFDTVFDEIATQVVNHSKINLVVIDIEQEIVT